MNALHRCLLLAALSLLGACAMGNRYDYNDTRVAVGYSGQARRVTVAAWDQRPYVLDGDKDPDFVGLQRNRMGIPFDVVTASKQPLATEMTDAMVRALATAGFGATRVTLPGGRNEAAARDALLASRPARALLLRVDNWESDTLKNPAVFYDLTLSVYDASGHRLAAKTVKGTDDLEGRFFNPMEKAKQIVPDNFRLKIESLLNAPEIAAALK